MYVPPAFAEERVEVLHEFMRHNSFANVVTGGAEGPVASHVPVLLLSERGKYGTLQMHLARQNGQWRELAGGTRALVMFQGPHAYVSPRWYRTAMTVPTWNYVEVHAYGVARVLDDEGLAGHLRLLTAAYEAAPGGWSTERIPEEVMRKMRGGIVGFEIEVERLEGKWKLGQNRAEADVRGAIRGLRESGEAEAVRVAEMMSDALGGKGGG